MISFSFFFSDDNSFHRYQEAKQKARQKCSYLDERNIILSPHLFAQPRSCVSGANDASDEGNSRWKASQISSAPSKSANPDVSITTERPNASDPSFVPINPSVSSDSMTQRQNTVSENSLQIHIVEVNSILPMIEWIPESSHEQMTEETTSWRCEGFVSVKHETRSPEALWKKASGQKIEWCRERLAKAAHLGSSPTAARPRVVIRRLARGRGHRGTSSHKEQKLKPLVNHKDLHNSYYSHSTLKNRYGCLCSPVQPRLRHSTDQRDAAQTLDMKQQCQEREFSNATGVRFMFSNYTRFALKAQTISLGFPHCFLSTSYSDVSVDRCPDLNFSPLKHKRQFLQACKLNEKQNNA